MGRARRPRVRGKERPSHRAGSRVVRASRRDRDDARPRSVHADPRTMRLVHALSRRVPDASAIVEPFVLDARRCIAYLTIEMRGPIPIELRPSVGEHLFGCDDCQTVCPFNSARTLASTSARYEPLERWETTALEDLLNGTGTSARGRRSGERPPTASPATRPSSSGTAENHALCRCSSAPPRRIRRPSFAMLRAGRSMPSNAKGCYRPSSGYGMSRLHAFSSASSSCSRRPPRPGRRSRLWIPRARRCEPTRMIPAASVALGRALRRAGRTADALTELRRGASTFAGHQADAAIKLHWELARAFIAQRDFSQAMIECRVVGAQTGGLRRVTRAPRRPTCFGVARPTPSPSSNKRGERTTRRSPKVARSRFK